MKTEKETPETQEEPQILTVKLPLNELDRQLKPQVKDDNA